MKTKQIFDHLRFCSDVTIPVNIREVYCIGRPGGWVSIPPSGSGGWVDMSPNSTPTITINLASPILHTADLAFTIGHELGHIICQREFVHNYYTLPRDVKHAWEYAADLCSVDLLLAGGFNVQKAVDWMRIDMDECETHPSNADRLKNVNNYLRAKEDEYRKNIDKTLSL